MNIDKCTGNWYKNSLLYYVRNVQEICIKVAIYCTLEICRKSDLSFRNPLLEITPYYLQEIVYEMSSTLQGGNLHDSPSFLLKYCIHHAVGNVTFGPV